MGPLRIRVTPLGEGYLAESRAPLVRATGASPDEAAEKVRLMATEALDAFDCREYPSTLIVRIDERNHCAIAMQSIHEPFSLDAAGKDYGSCYFDSAGNGGPAIG